MFRSTWLPFEVIHKEGSIQSWIWGHLCDLVHPLCLVLPVDEDVIAAMLGQVHPRHCSSTRRQLLLHVDNRGLEQLHLPIAHVTDADALCNVLPTHCRCSRCHYLWPERQEGHLKCSKFNEVVCEAEALLGPACLPQVPSQEGIRCRPVQLAAQRLMDFPSFFRYLFAGASAVRHESQPIRQILKLILSVLVKPRSGQGAGDTSKLELDTPNWSRCKVNVQVGKCTEQHVLWIGSTVKSQGSVQACVNL
mmetsp:Transcript_88571/g.223033  ORF Transcript_88571/g.223033 Transcript_88571/m.223033 type:complete len:249 (+) Transcript_88571:389-1135(+)